MPEQYLEPLSKSQTLKNLTFGRSPHLLPAFFFEMGSACGKKDT